MRAAFDGSKEIAFTILSMTLSLAAVFIPVLFMGGIVGRLLHEFAVTIGVAILVSGFVSISLTPMLCSRFLKPPHAQKHGRFYNATERVFDAWLRLYDWTLRRSAAVPRRDDGGLGRAARRHRSTSSRSIPKGFLPSEDQGRFNVSTEAIQGIGFDEMVRHQHAGRRHRRRRIRTSPASATTSAAGRAAAASTQGRIERRPEAARRARRCRSTRSSRSCGRSWRRCRASASSWSTSRRSTSAASRARAACISSRCRTPTRTSCTAGRRCSKRRCAQLPGLEDVSSDLQIKNPQVQVDMDRDKISALGLTVNQVETALYNAYGTRQVSQIYAPNNQYQVILQVAPEFQKRSGGAVDALRPVVDAASWCRSNTVAKVTTDVGPLDRQPHRPAAVGDDLVQPEAGRRARRRGDARFRRRPRPRCRRRSSTSFQGAAQAFQDSLQGLGLILLMAIVVIYIVLGILYESFTHPLTILSGLPSAGFGALLTLLHLQDRAEPLRVRRRHHARRPREEERHHDGGLRRRGAARRTARRRSRRFTRPASSASARS